MELNKLPVTNLYKWKKRNLSDFEFYYIMGIGGEAIFENKYKRRIHNYFIVKEVSLLEGIEIIYEYNG